MEDNTGKSGKYLDDFGLDHLWKKIKSLFILKTSVSASGNRASDSIVSASTQGQVNSSKYAITQYSTTTTDNVVKARIEYNATTSAIDFNFI